MDHTVNEDELVCSLAVGFDVGYTFVTEIIAARGLCSKHTPNVAALLVSKCLNFSLEKRARQAQQQ